MQALEVLATFGLAMSAATTRLFGLPSTWERSLRNAKKILSEEARNRLYEGRTHEWFKTNWAIERSQNQLAVMLDIEDVDEELLQAEPVGFKDLHQFRRIESMKQRIRPRKDARGTFKYF